MRVIVSWWSVHSPSRARLISSQEKASPREAVTDDHRVMGEYYDAQHSLVEPLPPINRFSRRWTHFNRNDERSSAYKLLHSVLFTCLSRPSCRRGVYIIYIYTYIHAYIHFYIFVCVCVCIYMYVYI
jgi:hypothetical protein